VFRSGVDLLTVQASVLDKDGRPVRDLQASDFTVTVSGQPRKVVFARFNGADATGVYGRSAGSAAVPGAAPPPSGRLVMFVIDRDTIRTGGEKALVTAATIVLDALAPSDAVGLVGLPAGGVKPTREHQRVRSALNEMTGTMPSVAWRWHITWAEAEGIERGDKQMLAQAYQRECRPPRRPPPDCPDCPVPGPPEGCMENLPAQAREMLMNARSQTRATLANLRALADRLRPMRGPKHIVLISGGMRFDQELLGEFNHFTREAATAGLVFHTVHVDQPDTDVATERRAITSAFGSREMSAGLTTIAGMTGGSFFYGVGAAVGVFERIGTEITNFYELGLEALASDADGKPRDLSVKVNREGVSVRARAQVALDPSIAPKPGTPEALRTLLEQPTDIGDLPMQLGAYTTRGDDSSLLKVLLTAQIGAGTVRAPVQWGFIVLNEENVIASGRSSLEKTETSPDTFTASAKLLPGRHRLRFAAIDADGRAGVADLALTVGLRAAGGLQLSDLIVGSSAGGRFLPSSRIQSGVPLAAMIEVLSNDAPRLAKTRVALEIIPDGTTEPVQRVLMAARSGIADTILLNEAQISTSALAPGRYTASATVLIDAQPVGKVSRGFEVSNIPR
jgi:VWFA-related protein